MPVLVAVGTKDVDRGLRAGAGGAAAGGQALDIPGRDHMLAVGDKVFKAGRAELPGRAALTRHDRPLDRPSPLVGRGISPYMDAQAACTCAKTASRGG